MGNHRLNFTELAGKLCWALTSVLVDAVSACATVLAHVALTIVHICRAVLTNKSWETFTSEMSEVVLARPSILTGIGLDTGTEGNLLFTISPLKSRRAATLIGSHLIHTCSVVLATVFKAVINIFLTSHTREPRRTLAQESAGLKDLALGLVDTRIAIAGIDDLSACFAVETRGTPALKITVWQRTARGSILARISEA